MTQMVRPARVARRPAGVRVTVTLLVLLGVTAVAGSVRMVSAGAGDDTFPGAWLDPVPLIDSWTAPGLVLGLGFGVGSLITAHGLLRRPRWSWLAAIDRWTGHHWSWAATVALGVGLVLWIVVQLWYLPETLWLQAVYGGLGVVLAALPLTSSVRSDLSIGGRGR